MKSLETISSEITVLEAERDYGNITPEGLETLAVLNLCYDLLTRIKAAQAIKVDTPPEMIEPGFDDDETCVYGVSSSQLADHAFVVDTGVSKENETGYWKSLVLLLQEIAKDKGISQIEIAEKTGIAQGNISRIFSLRFCPKLETFLIIAQAIGVNFFFESKDSPTDLNVLLERAMDELGRRS